ncbi:hypothetical protein COO60DRAFT_1520152, partial [Scenedesmus sp. NREL 46B-D3]
MQAKQRLHRASAAAGLHAGLLAAAAAAAAGRALLLLLLCRMLHAAGYCMRLPNPQGPPQRHLGTRLCPPAAWTHLHWPCTRNRHPCALCPCCNSRRCYALHCCSHHGCRCAAVAAADVCAAVAA